MEEMNDSKKHALMFLFTFIAAAVIILDGISFLAILQKMQSMF